MLRQIGETIMSKQSEEDRQMVLGFKEMVQYYRDHKSFPDYMYEERWDRVENIEMNAVLRTSRTRMSIHVVPYC